MVDDMVGVRKLIKMHLNSMGYLDTVEAENGEDAFTMLSTSSEGSTVGLVLSDWRMPGGNGNEFLKKVRGTPKFEKLPFLVVTAEGEVSALLTMVQLGASEYIVKPFTPDILMKKLSIVWRKHNPEA